MLMGAVPLAGYYINRKVSRAHDAMEVESDSGHEHDEIGHVTKPTGR